MLTFRYGNEWDKFAEHTLCNRRAGYKAGIIAFVRSLNICNVEVAICLRYKSSFIHGDKYRKFI
jgi:hypothetical protein